MICRAWTILLAGVGIILTILTAAIGVSAHSAYTSPSTGVALRWDLSTFVSNTIPYYVNPSPPSGAVPIIPAGTTARDLIGVVRSAFQVWQDIPAATVRYSYQGVTDRTNGLDGMNVVTFNPAAPLAASGVTFIFAALQPGPVPLPGGGSINANFAGQIVDADIALNPQTTFTIADGVQPTGQIPLEGTIMHEIGHFMGLDHSGVVGTIMYGFTNLGRGRINRAPREDDILGISTLYPSPEFLAGTGEITGHVADQTGAPVFGSQVAAIDSATGAIVGAALTGVVETLQDGSPSVYSRSSGKYILRGLPPGNYLLIAEPMDGPNSPALSGLFGTGSGGTTTINSSFLPSALVGPIVVTAQTSQNVDIGVNSKSPASPNLGAAPFASVSNQAFVAGAEVERGGGTTLLSIGSSENLINGAALIPNATFSATGAGVTVGAASVTSGSIRLPVTAAQNATPAPRLLTVDTPQGKSVVSGGIIVIPPATHFAQFANGPGTTSTAIIVNPSSTAAIGRLTFRNDQGASAKTGFILSSRDSAGPTDLEPVQKTSFDFVVAPLGMRTIHTDGSGAMVSGSAVLRATQAVGGIIKFGIQGLGIAGVERSTSVSGFITPVRRAGALNTGIAIGNATSQQFQITLTLRDRAGVPVAPSLSRTLPADGHFAAFITELFSSIDLTSFEGTLTATTGSAAFLITGTALELGGNPGEFTALPVTEIQEQPSEVVLRFAQIANGAGVVSDIVVTNASATASLGGRVEFFDDSGNPLSLPIAESGAVARIDLNIPPLGSRTYKSTGQGPLVAGWARVTTNRASGGVGRFSLPGLGIAGVGKSDALDSGFIIPIRSNSSQGIDTGIAVVNAGETAVDLELTLRTAEGTPVGDAIAIPNFPARGHLSRMAKELFGNAVLEDFEGTLTVRSKTPGGRIAGTALELGASAGQFTTLPVTPLQ